MTANPWLMPACKAIRERLAADTTLTGLLGNGALSIRTGFAPAASDPPGTTYPCVQVWPINGAGNNTGSFRGRRDETMFCVRFSVPKLTTVSGFDCLQTLCQIHERIMGDWPEQVFGVDPTHGLDRFFPVFTTYTGVDATTYSSDMLRYEGWNSETDDSDDIQRWVINFTCSLQKRSP